jgi:hypothetical protein
MFGLNPLVAHVPLPSGDFALIDAEDAGAVLVRSWNLTGFAGKRRVVGRFGNKKVYLHRFVMLAPDSVLVDHINGDPLDCRKQNLRYCDHSQNAKNRLPNRTALS